MIFKSTRNRALTATGCEAVLNGIAPDGGLYMPEAFPRLLPEEISGLSARGIAKKILGAYFDELSEEEIAGIADAAYAGRFETEELTPLEEVRGAYVLELFRGPTQAFKDVALSVLPHLMAAAQKKTGLKKELLILTATSGDTGKAALAGFANVPGTRILVFYPENGVSGIQRLQMTTQEGENAAVCAVRGNFDDAQTAVKAVFASDTARAAFKAQGIAVSSANSINIGRLVPQIMYYYKAYADLVRRGATAMGESVNFAVPTGNFGNILAGYFAKRMGLPVGTLICASNANDVLTDFIRTGRYDRRRAFHRTASPSMDILVSSNLERLLYLLCGENDEKTRAYMQRLSKDGFYDIEAQELSALQSEFFAARCGEESCLATIMRVFEESGYLCDTHTAVAFEALRQYQEEAGLFPTLEGRPVEPGRPAAVVLATASPFKFPRAVLCALEGDAPEDEFSAIARLEEISSVQAPVALKALKKIPERHKDVINLEETEAYILRKAEQNTW